MQVRKYEASSIKEAVQQVKEDLGPEAIILSTRDAVRRLGSVPHHKVIVTAAVNEEVYRKKQVVEKKLTESELKKIHQRPVREQKQLIDHVYNNLAEKVQEKRKKKTSNVPYALIEDDLEPESSADEEMVPDVPKASVAERRVQGAIEAAAQAISEMDLEIEEETQASRDHDFEVNRVQALKKEVERLKKIIQGQKTSQTVVEIDEPKKKKSSPHVDQWLQYLDSLGVDKNILNTLQQEARTIPRLKAENKSQVDSWFAKWTLGKIKVTPHFENKFHYFVGAPGVGKTSGLIKVASQLVLKQRKKVAVVTTDTNKIGAVEQLRIYCQILNVPMAVLHPGQGIKDFGERIRDFDHVLIDMPGLDLYDTREIDQVRGATTEYRNSVSIHLVLSARMEKRELYSLCQRYKSINYNDIMVTHLDHRERLGQIINIADKLSLPFSAFSNGPKVPEDFYWATKEAIIDSLFNLSNSYKAGA